MSRKEVLAVIRGGYRSYLMRCGFEKPIFDEDIIIRNASFPERHIRIFTTPMLRGQVNYQLRWPGLDDYQGIFKFRPDPEFYSWESPGWLEYRDETDLVNGFDFAKQVHDRWLNDVLNAKDIGPITERLNSIRRSGVARYAGLSTEQKNVAHHEWESEGRIQTQFVRTFPPSGWARELLGQLSNEGKFKQRVSEYWIEGDAVRGPKYDGQFRIVRTRIFIEEQPTHFYFFSGEFFDDRHRTLRYFEEDGRIWGPPGDPPWVKEWEAELA